MRPDLMLQSRAGHKPMRVGRIAACVAVLVVALVGVVLGAPGAHVKRLGDHFLTSSTNTCPTFSSNATERAGLDAKFKRLVEMMLRYDGNHTVDGKRHAFGNTTTTTRLAYFKSHKTGSSTMEALMINFARKHDLMPVNSVVDYNQHVGVHLGCPDALRSQPATRGAFDIEFRHLLEGESFKHLDVPGKCYEEPGFFSRVVESYEWLIGGPGTPIVTTWREPVSQFLSSFGFYVYRTPQYIRQPYETALVDYVNNGNPVFNSVARDYGFNATAAGAAAFAEEFLQSDRVLAVVLERLMESLVVLRRLFGWDFADVLHLATNEAGVSKHQERTAVQVTDQALMNETTRRIAARQRGVDDVVYRAALAQLDSRVAAALRAETQEDLASRSSRWKGEESAPPCFTEEVKDLQWAVDSVATLCGCTKFLSSKQVVFHKKKQATTSRGFDLVRFCDSFDEKEEVREESMTREPNAKLQGALLRTRLGDAGMGALNFVVS